MTGELSAGDQVFGSIGMAGTAAEARRLGQRRQARSPARLPLGNRPGESERPRSAIATAAVPPQSGSTSTFMSMYSWACACRRTRRRRLVRVRSFAPAPPPAAAAGALDAPRDVGSCLLACAPSADASEAPPTAYGGEKPGPAPGGTPPDALTVLGAGALDTAGSVPAAGSDAADGRHRRRRADRRGVTGAVGTAATGGARGDGRDTRESGQPGKSRAEGRGDGEGQQEGRRLHQRPEQDGRMKDGPAERGGQRGRQAGDRRLQRVGDAAGEGDGGKRPPVRVEQFAQRPGEPLRVVAAAARPIGPATRCPPQPRLVLSQQRFRRRAARICGAGSAGGTAARADPATAW